jgi:hypothetical protein
MIIVAFASPILGGVIAGLFALQAHNDRNIPGAISASSVSAWRC